MAKILLAYDDYAVMMSAETAFKKAGHETLALNNEANIIDQISNFLPDFVVAYGSGEKVNCVRVGEKLKAMGDYNGSVVLIFAPHARPTPDDLIRVRVDHVLEAPVPPARLTNLVANASKNKKEEKIFVRSKASAVPAKKEESQFIEGGNENQTKTTVKSDPSPKDPVKTFSKEAPATAPVASATTPPAEPVQKAPTEARPKPKLEARSNEDEGSGSGLFGGIDLKSLEKEVLNSLPPLPPKKTVLEEMADMKKKEASGEFSHHQSEPDTPINLESIHADLKNAQESRQERMAKYNSLELPSFDLTKSTVDKRSAKRSLREMAKEWDEAELKSQDELRREFVKSLLKK